MKQSTFLNLNFNGIVIEADEEACSLAGLPRGKLLNAPLTDHVQSDHRIRLDSEIKALVNDEEKHGRVSCTMIGLDNIGRQLTMRLSKSGDDVIHVDLSSNIHVERSRTDDFTLANPQRLLPVFQRIITICRCASTKEAFLSDCLAVLTEVTSASCAATIDWGNAQSGWPVTTVLGPFDESCFLGVFRSAVIGRLAQGDVIIKESIPDQTDDQTSLILVPLMATKAPEGIVVLSVDGYSVLVPQEQQSLAAIGQIMGLGLNALNAKGLRDRSQSTKAADIEATIALGRLSAGLAHEINNATTVLRNNIEQLSSFEESFKRETKAKSALKDSINAVQTIRNLTDALRAFAPEETRNKEEVDLLRIISMVLAAVRFHAKRGINVELTPPAEDVLMVQCHSHYLIRSLFLIFVELVEPSINMGQELNATVTIEKKADLADLTISVSTGPFNVPTVFLEQLEHSGALDRHVRRAGAGLSHTLDNGELKLSLTLPIARKIEASHTSSNHTDTHTKTARSGTILVVDDDTAILRSMRRILEPNHDVLAAASGPEALQIIKANSTIDVILIDVFMPGMMGIQLHKEIVRLYPTAAKQVIFVTAGTSDKTFTRYIQETSCPLIEKPIDISKLNQLIAKMIG